MLRVRCQAEVKVDAKGRVPLPARIRRALQDAGKNQLVLVYHRGAIWGWTRDHFEDVVEAPIAGADQFDDTIMDTVHARFSTAQDVDLDKAGRIRISPILRDLAGLGKEVVVNSVMNRIEVWDAKAWDNRFNESLGRNG